MLKKIFKKINVNKYKKGFTLIELIVVIGIISVVSTLTLFNSSSLDSSLLVSNTAYEISLAIRDAQVSGLGAKLLSDGSNATSSNQGIYFNILEPRQIILFSDFNKNNKYDGLVEDVQKFNIENRRAGKILKICTLDGLNNCTDVSYLNILFKRPNPEAYFYTSNDNGIFTEHKDNIAINIGSDSGHCKTILVYKSGGIQMDKSLCDN